MAGLKTIKQKIGAMKKSQTITRAMEAVAASKMRKSQQRAIKGRAYARAAAATLSRLSGSQELATHPLTRGAEKLSAEKSSGSPQTISSSNFSTLYIAITSDKGLAGALNSSVLRAIQKEIQPGVSYKAIAVGKKAEEFFRTRGTLLKSYLNDDNVFDHAAEIVALAEEKFLSGEFDVVKVIYQHFVSTFEQRPSLEVMLPFSVQELQKVADEARVHTYTLEPGPEEVLSVILPKLAQIFVYHALLESQACEHSARMVAMKSASDKAEELQEGLQIKFNKARQASITREVSEIVGGMEAVSN